MEMDRGGDYNYDFRNKFFEKTKRLSCIYIDTAHDSRPLNVLDLNDFVILKIFSHLTEFEKYFCSQVCVRFSNIVLNNYSDTMAFDKELKKYFLQSNDNRDNRRKCCAIIKALGSYWKHIHISHEFSILRASTVLKFVKKFCPNVEHLTLQFNNIESKFVLNNLPKKLQTISLSVECGCKENWLTPLRDCVNVVHLSLQFTLIDKKKINKMLRGDFLRNLPNLKVLIFNGCRPSESALTKCFRNSTEISVLELNCDLPNVTNGLIEVILLKLQNLQRIKLQPVQSLRLDRLGLLAKLKYLSLDSWVPNDLNSLLRNLITRNIVQCFELDNCQSFIHSEIIADLHKWTNLRYLHIDYMESFDDRFLRQFAKSGNLNYFHFSGRSRNVSVGEMINFMTRSAHLEVFDFHIYYESSDTHTPDTINDVEQLKEFQKSATERIKMITIYNTAISVHCSGGFHVKKENAFQRQLAKSINLNLAKGFGIGN